MRRVVLWTAWVVVVFLCPVAAGIILYLSAPDAMGYGGPLGAFAAYGLWRIAPRRFKP